MEDLPQCFTRKTAFNDFLFAFLVIKALLSDGKQNLIALPPFKHISTAVI